jgi:hypothetical protein
MTNPRGQAALNAQRKWRAAHPEARTSTGTPEQKKARREQIKAINPCYLKEARAILQGKDVRGRNKCVKLPGD